MCAIFGWFNPEFASTVDKARLLRHLARKCQMYGEKSFGLAARKNGGGPGSKLETVRYTGSASTWLEQNADDLVAKFAKADVLIGHTRLPTHGAVTKLNAHPFPLGDWLAAHNGCIQNSAALMAKATLVAKGETDSEEALAYVVANEFSVEALKEIDGSFAFCAMSRDGRRAVLVCDSRQNLYAAKVGEHGLVWCTSEEILASSLAAAGHAGAVIQRIQSQVIRLPEMLTEEIPTPASAHFDYRGWQRKQHKTNGNIALTIGEQKLIAEQQELVDDVPPENFTAEWQ